MFTAPLALALAILPGEKVPPAPVAVPARPVAARPLMPLAAVQFKARVKDVDFLVPLPTPPAPASSTTPTGPVGGPADEGVLKAAKLEMTDDALLAFFRKR